MNPFQIKACLFASNLIPIKKIRRSLRKKISRKYGALIKKNKPVTEADLEQFKYELFGSIKRDEKLLPTIVPIQKTIDEIINHKKSLCRFGDGEFLIAMNEGELQYQKNDGNLSDRLMEIIVSDDEKILIGIEDFFGSLSHLSDVAAAYSREFLRKRRHKMYGILNFDKAYHSSQITRPYKIMRNKETAAAGFENLKQIWKDQQVIIVEGSMSRLGVGNDLFEGADSLKRIIAPAKSAFDHYEDILKTVKKNCTKTDLILIALGPTATVLSYDLAQDGFWALDIGNIDLDYEWFLKQDESYSIIENKFIWCEKNGGSVNEVYDDEGYLSEIVASVNNIHSDT